MFPALLEKLAQREDLTTAEADAAMEEIMAGRASPAETAALLVGLRSKGERPREIVGLARTMRRHAVAIEAPPGEVFDTCGTGGDGAGTFNVSSVVAVTVAACGVRVAKHGNRSVSSRCGSADLFEALGVRVTAAPEVVARSLREAGIGFFFAPTFHPAMRHAAPVRKTLGIRTAFNLLGPLTNPAGAARQLVGVPRPEMTELLARALALLGSTHVWVVHGADGLDEIATSGYTKVSECRAGYLRTFYVHPSEFGIAKSATSALRGGDAAENAALATEVLQGGRGPLRDVTLLNAGAALFVAGRAGSVTEGLAQAARAIDSGAALDTLGRMVAISSSEVNA
jgi:anthranilate phosphoribosyltransferase